MPIEPPLPAYAVVYQQTADGRWKVHVADILGVSAEGADIDEAKDRIAAKARAHLARVGRDGLVASTTVVGYVHFDGPADRDKAPNTSTLF